jgi:hypothetical protein
MALGVCEWVLNVDLEESENKKRPSPEQLPVEFDRVMRRPPTVSSQTLNRSGQNPQRGTRFQLHISNFSLTHESSLEGDIEKCIISASDRGIR